MSIFVAFFSTYNLYSLFFRWAETHRLVARYFRYGFFSFGWFCPTRGTQSSAAATFASSLSPSELKRVLAQAWGFRLAGPGLKAQTWILSLKVPGSILVIDMLIEKQIDRRNKLVRFGKQFFSEKDTNTKPPQRNQNFFLRKRPSFLVLHFFR